MKTNKFRLFFLQKSIKVYLFIAMVIVLFSSCKKTNIENEQPGKPAGDHSPAFVSNCNYTPLTQTSTGLWSCQFEGNILNFSNLNMGHDGRLYGQLVSVENTNGYTIISGGEDAWHRHIAYERISCSATFGIKKTETLVSQGTYFLVGNGNTYANYNGATNVTQGSFVILSNSGVLIGVVEWESGELKYKQIHYDWTYSPTCTSGNLVAGKLVAKGVHFNSTTGVYTADEYGFSNMCYPDPIVPTSGD